MLKALHSPIDLDRNTPSSEAKPAPKPYRDGREENADEHFLATIPKLGEENLF